MKIRIEPYRAEMVEAVLAFNRRLEAVSGVHPTRLPETASPSFLSNSGQDRFCQECFLACDGNSVRGGYILYRQIWSIRGESVAVGNCMRPISEGLIDRSYALVGLRIIHDALRRQPLQFGFGLAHTPMYPVLKTMGWEIRPVPFYFKILKGRRFLERLPALHRTPARAHLANTAAAVGLGTLGTAIASRLSFPVSKRSLTIEEIGTFTSWSDRLWEAASRAYSVLPVRDSVTLNRLFGGRSEFTCLKLSEDSGPVGWAVLDSISSNQARFGDLKVQSIMDCLALPQDADAVAQAAAEYLWRRDADIILSNQSHPAWRKALRRAGFLRGPSTFLFGSVPALTSLLHEADPRGEATHFTRGGGDVPLVWNTALRAVNHAVSA